VTFHDRYQIQRRLGGGGFGEVYLAEDMNLGVEVALKFINRGCDNPSQIENFQTEGRRLARLCNELNDPCICRVWDCDFDQTLNVHFIAMKYYPSGTFQDLLRSHAFQGGKAAVNPRYVALLAKQMARTLQRIHDAGIVHRDLKPANILLGENGRPVITDFGIAWSNENFFDFMNAGTPPYMSPEHRRGDIPEPTDDIYALGMIIYEALAGSIHPFDITRYTRRPRVGKDFGPLGRELDRVIARATARHCDDRYDRMAELADHLESLVRGAGIETSHEPFSISKIAARDIDYRFVGPGTTAPTPDEIRNRVFLNVGNRLCPGVIDHHQGLERGMAASAARLVVENPELVSAAAGKRDEGSRFTIILPDNLSLDSLVASYLSTHILTKNCLPEGAAGLAWYADKVDSGSGNPGNRSLYACARLLHAVLEPTGRGDWRKKLVLRFHKAIAFALKKHRDGSMPIDKVEVLDAPGLFSPNKIKEFDEDRARYVNKLLDADCKAHRSQLLIPYLDHIGGQKKVESLLIRKVQDRGDRNRVMFFKDWARSDREMTPGSSGFEFLCIHCRTSDGQGRCILSVTPESGLSLARLAKDLEAAEVAKRKLLNGGVDDRAVDPISGKSLPIRPGYDTSDPWYDGRGHSFTIVDSPRNGTILAPEEIEEIVLRFGSSQTKSLPARKIRKGSGPQK
jgi:serine/threonine protein kinase